MTSTDHARPGTLSIRVHCKGLPDTPASVGRARDLIWHSVIGGIAPPYGRWFKRVYRFCEELATVPGRWSVTVPNGDRKEFNDLYDLRQVIDSLPFVLNFVLNSPHGESLPLGVGGSTFLRFRRLSDDRVYAGIVRMSDEVAPPNNEVSAHEVSDEIYRFLLQIEAISEAKGLRSFEVIRPWFEIALAQVMPKGI